MKKVIVCSSAKNKLSAAICCIPGSPSLRVVCCTEVNLQASEQLPVIGQFLTFTSVEF